MVLTRRSFIKSAAGSAVVAIGGSGSLLDAASPATYGPGNKWPGKVSFVFNNNAVEGTATPVPDVIKKMVDDAIMQLAGETDLGAAWRAVFPASLTRQSTIAIKINILNNALPRPSEYSVAAICEGLCRMELDGEAFPASNITLYDANNTNSMDSAGYTADLFPGITRVKDSFGNYGDGARDLGYATTLNSHDFLINVFSPRGISSGNAEGFTLGFKSHYGTYENPRNYHGDASPTHLRDINCTGPVLEKSVLSVCSGIFGMNEGSGPRGDAVDYSTYSKKIDPTSTATSPCTIIMSTDPVSVEMQAIKMMRMNRNPTADYAIEALPSYLRASGGVNGALDTVYNIGIIDETEMDIRRMINDESTSTASSHPDRLQRSFLRVIPMRRQRFVLMEFHSFGQRSGQTAVIEIHTLNGKKLFSTAHPVSGKVTSLVWNRRTISGRTAGTGTYIARLTLAGCSTTERFTLSG